jgi:hypothetical protein
MEIFWGLFSVIWPKIRPSGSISFDGSGPFSGFGSDPTAKQAKMCKTNKS